MFYLKNLPPKVQQILVVSAVLSLPFAILCGTLIILNNKNVKYISQDFELAIGGNKEVAEASSNNEEAVELLLEKVDNLESQIIRLKTLPNPEAKNVVTSFEEEIKPTVEAVVKTSDDLQKAVDLDAASEEIVSDRLSEVLED